MKILTVFLYLLLLSSHLPAKAQIAASAIQQLSFGTFCQGIGGGAINVSPEGTRTATGDIIMLNQGGVLYMPAIIEVTAPAGSRITIVETNAQLMGSNGGSMTLHINGADPVSPFSTTLPSTDISIGGSLTVGSQAANPPGKYSGLFYVTFMSE